MFNETKKFMSRLSSRSFVPFICIPIMTIIKVQKDQKYSAEQCFEILKFVSREYTGDITGEDAFITELSKKDFDKYFFKNDKNPNSSKRDEDFKYTLEDELEKITIKKDVVIFNENDKVHLRKPEGISLMRILRQCIYLNKEIPTFDEFTDKPKVISFKISCAKDDSVNNIISGDEIRNMVKFAGELYTIVYDGFHEETFEDLEEYQNYFLSKIVDGEHVFNSDVAKKFYEFDREKTAAETAEFHEFYDETFGAYEEEVEFECDVINQNFSATKTKKKVRLVYKWDSHDGTDGTDEIIIERKNGTSVLHMLQAHDLFVLNGWDRYRAIEVGDIEETDSEVVIDTGVDNFST